jgi:hypothetical protein
LVFVLAVTVVAVLAGATNFREIAAHAGDLSQRPLKRLGGRWHPLHHKIVVPSEKRIRTLIQRIDATRLDEITGGWLWDLAETGRLEPLLTALAVDGSTCAVLMASCCSPRCFTTSGSSSPSGKSPREPTRPPRCRTCSTL